MNFGKSGLWAILISIVLLASAAAFADTNCEEGNATLNPTQPQGITTQEIIQKFAAHEELFRQARNNYAYTQDITVQELDGTTVTGEYRLVQEITYDDKGGRVENGTFAPQRSCRHVNRSREGLGDF